MNNMKTYAIIFGILTSLQSLAVDDAKIYAALESDSVSIIQKMVDSGEITVDQTISAQPYGAGTPIITIAGRAAALKTIQFLISRKADLNALTSAQESAVMLASYFNDEDGQMQPGYVQHEKAVRLLVESGASLESPAEKYTALSYAAYQGHDRILKYLISKGANVDGYITADGKALPNSPLMMNAMTGTTEGAKILLRAGANPNLVNTKGKNAITLAKDYANKDQAKLILCATQLQPGENFTAKCE